VNFFLTANRGTQCLLRAGWMLADYSIQLDWHSPKTSLQPWHSVHFTASGPKSSWSGSVYYTLVYYLYDNISI